jgi:FdhD protein
MNESLLEGSRSGPWPRCEGSVGDSCGSDASRDLSRARPKGVATRPVLRTRNGITQPVDDHIAEEVPVAFVYNDTPFAVMMATPADLEDFALGFSITEAIVADAYEVEAIEHRELLEGHELRIRIPRARAEALAERSRNLTGRSGCGLCGTEMLEAAMREPPPVPPGGFELSNDALQRALDQLPHHQPINALTGATHAAAWCDAEGNIVLAREDVGRHNALDKLVGAMESARIGAERGFALVTSRASHEIVAKCATAGIATIAAVSAPTTLAIALARRTGITLTAFARPGANATRVAGPDSLSHATSPADPASRIRLQR